MGLTVDFLKEVALEVRRRVYPLLGSKEAGVSVGIGVGGDRTKLIDSVAEETVLSIVKQKAFSCTIISEESGVVAPFKGSGGDGYLIVDPLDGTNNAIKGIPFACVSLAAADKPFLSSVHSAVVCDLFHGETFWASRGEGAFNEGGPLNPSRIDSLRRALLGVDLNPPIPSRIGVKLLKILRTVKHSRYLGANALEVCFVASGRLDGFVELRNRIRVTDVAASQLIVREAGGIIVDEAGRPLDSKADSPKYHLSFIAAGNRKLLNQILRFIR
jgi:myo-inositol-1(or 4)-monophosphatase